MPSRKINNATHGFYLANILKKKYYYCGTEWEDVERTLREDLGIGAARPAHDSVTDIEIC